MRNSGAENASSFDGMFLKEAVVDTYVPAPRLNTSDAFCGFRLNTS